MIKPQSLLLVRPVKVHPLDAYLHAVEPWERDENYDGQGKSQQQESDDSLRMLVVCAVIMVVSVVLAAVLVFR